MTTDRVHAIDADSRTVTVTGDDTVDYAPPMLPYDRVVTVEPEEG